jgi:hypothetical protein
LYAASISAYVFCSLGCNTGNGLQMAISVPSTRTNKLIKEVFFFQLIIKKLNSSSNLSRRLPIPRIVIPERVKDGMRTMNKIPMRDAKSQTMSRSCISTTQINNMS